jgi:hypothetical protein
VRRYTFRVLQLLAVALAYVLVRASINTLTGVDPGNFPTALATLTVLLALPMWLVIIPFVALVMSVAYGVIAHYGQNACITFRFTRASRGADGYSVLPALEAG